MKPKTLLLALVVSFCTISNAAPDNETIPTLQLQLLPDLDVLYFNQTLDFALPESSTDVVDHVEFKRGLTEITAKGFTLSIDYANIPEANDELKVYVRKANGDITLAYDKKITLKQKLSEKGFESVGNDDNIFKLDNEVEPLHNFISKEKLLKASRLNINADRFEQDNIKLKSFDLQINTAEGVQLLHSVTGEITPEMKIAIQNLANRDSITFINIMTEYAANKQIVKLNLNYTVKYVIATVG